MPDYKNGKIYKLTCGGLTYYGSTTLPTVAHRLAQHKSDFKKWLLGKRNNCTSFRLLQIGEPVIATLIEKVECSCKDELTRRERFYIENNECVNKNVPSRTREEWLIDNPEYFTEYRKIHFDKWTKYNADYRKTHLEEYAKYQAKYYQKNSVAINAKLREKRALKKLSAQSISDGTRTPTSETKADGEVSITAST